MSRSSIPASDPAMLARALPMLLLISAVAPADARAAARDDDEPKAASEWLKELRKGLKERRSADPFEHDDAIRRAVGAIDHLTSDFDLYDERTQKDVVRGVASVLAKWMDEDSRPLHYAAAAALSEMGDAGADAIRKTRSMSHLDVNVDVRCMLIEALGKHHQEGDLSYFLKLLDDDEPQRVRSACNALAEYYEADPRIRKRIFEEVLSVYGKAHDNDAKKKGEDPYWRERLLRIEVPMNQVLDRMTGYDLQSVPEWREWWAQHRDEDW